MKRYVKEFANDMLNSLSNNAACLPIRKAIENAVRMCARSNYRARMYPLYSQTNGIEGKSAKALLYAVKLYR